MRIEAHGIPCDSTARVLSSPCEQQRGFPKEGAADPAACKRGSLARRRADLRRMRRLDARGSRAVACTRLSVLPSVRHRLLRADPMGRLRCTHRDARGVVQDASKGSTRRSGRPMEAVFAMLWTACPDAFALLLIYPNVACLPGFVSTAHWLGIRAGFDGNLCFCNLLLVAYARHVLMASARQVFDKMCPQDVMLYNAGVRVCWSGGPAGQELMVATSVVGSCTARP